MLCLGLFSVACFGLGVFFVAFGPASKIPSLDVVGVCMVLEWIRDGFWKGELLTFLGIWHDSTMEKSQGQI